jgi:hypothetical protein
VVELAEETAVVARALPSGVLFGEWLEDAAGSTGGLPESGETAPGGEGSDYSTFFRAPAAPDEPPPVEPPPVEPPAEERPPEEPPPVEPPPVEPPPAAEESPPVEPAATQENAASPSQVIPPATDEPSPKARPGGSEYTAFFEVPGLGDVRAEEAAPPAPSPVPPSPPPRPAPPPPGPPPPPPSAVPPPPGQAPPPPTTTSRTAPPPVPPPPPAARPSQGPSPSQVPPPPLAGPPPSRAGFPPPPPPPPPPPAPREPVPPPAAGPDYTREFGVAWTPRDGEGKRHPEPGEGHRGDLYGSPPLGPPRVPEDPGAPVDPGPVPHGRDPSDQDPDSITVQFRKPRTTPQPKAEAPHARGWSPSQEGRAGPGLPLRDYLSKLDRTGDSQPGTRPAAQEPPLWKVSPPSMQPAASGPSEPTVVSPLRPPEAPRQGGQPTGAPPPSHSPGGKGGEGGLRTRDIVILVSVIVLVILVAGGIVLFLLLRGD